MWHDFVDCCDVGFISTQLPSGQEVGDPLRALPEL